MIGDASYENTQLIAILSVQRTVVKKLPKGSRVCYSKMGNISCDIQLTSAFGVGTLGLQA